MAQMITIEKIDASLIGIGSIIKSSRFLIPIYQRPYSWTDAQIEDLYRDVADAIAPRSKTISLDDRHDPQ